MRKYVGQTVNQGIVIKKIFVINNEIPFISYEKIEDTAKEEERLENAFSEAVTYLNKSRELIKSNKYAAESGEIIDAHIMLLEDTSEESLQFRAKEIIRQEKTGAEYAVDKVAGILSAEFSKEGASEYLAARSEDIEHIKNIVLCILLGISIQSELTEPSIVVTKELSPEQLTAFDSRFVSGIVTTKGSPLSHTAIIAQNMNIPYITGIDLDFDNGLGDVRNDIIGIIDSTSDSFIYEPDEETLRYFENKEKQYAETKASLLEGAKELVAQSPIMLCANIGKVEEATEAVNNCAEGIGLFRSEFLFLDADEVPSEDIQYEAYVKVLDTMNGKPVIVRTIDIGADKEAKCISLPKEPNPALGTRGIRICFANPPIFRTQLRALLRAAYGRNLKVMFPMISSLWEVRKAVDTVNEVSEELKKEGIQHSIPQLGIMVETPAAALTLDDMAPYIDFVSIGTNDLTQYTLGIDRVNAELADYYDAHHKAVLELIRETTGKAHKYGLQVGVCGELGADLQLAEEFLKMGIDELSMSPSAIPAMALKLSGISRPVDDITAPVAGFLIPMEEIPDPTFANGLLGQCVGLYPEDGIVTAPFDGVVTMVAQTGHAVSLRNSDGIEVLIHIGIDTVKMNGRGFDVKVSEGESIKAGSELVTFDIEMIEASGLSPIVVVVKLQG